MQRGEFPDSGAGTSALSEESWQSSRGTAYSECTATLPNAQTARNARPHVRCRFQYWIWIGRSSTIRNASFVWLALMLVPPERFRQSSLRIASYPRIFIHGLWE